MVGVLSIAAWLGLASLYSSAQGATTVYRGIDNLPGPLGSHPQADLKRNQFLAALNPVRVGLQDFDSLSSGSVPAPGVVIGFVPGGVNATLVPFATEKTEIATGFQPNGQYPISGGQFLNTHQGTAAPAHQPYFTLTFDSPVTAVGFYATDVNEGTWAVPPTEPDSVVVHGIGPGGTDQVFPMLDITEVPFGTQAEASVLFWGVKSDVPFTQITVRKYDIAGNEGIGIDDLYISSQSVEPTALVWDPGTQENGSEVYSPPTTHGGDYYFRVTAQNSPLGAWRTILRVLDGEADLYLGRGFSPSPSSHHHKGEATGSDGILLSSGQFSPAEEWTILVRAAEGAVWQLFSGEPYVQDLGVLAADGSSGSGPQTIGPEGVRFFKTTLPADTRAWRLSLGGANNQINLRKAQLPFQPQLSQAGRMLVVPEYLNTTTFNGHYFIGVPGSPGTPIELDSRQQAVADLPFGSGTLQQDEVFGYRTFRVQVPVATIAWQITLTTISGNPEFAVRRNTVPNEFNNDAFSEVPGLVKQSVTLTPTTLSDGVFYITVYGDSPFSFTLENGVPEITDVPFLGDTVNDDVNRVGWRFYRVANDDGQLGTLGWLLELQNQNSGTQIALRANAVPGKWSYRSNGSTYDHSGHLDVINTGFLQRPGHQADYWYIGVYNPSMPLGAFTLRRRILDATPLAYAGGTATNPTLTAPRIDYYAVTIPPNTHSWKVRLTPTSGDVRLGALLGRLPGSPGSSTGDISYPPGVLLDIVGNECLTVIPSYLTSENVIPAGTYYLSVECAPGAATAGYTLESLGPLPILQLGDLGTGAIEHADLVSALEVKAYHFTVPPGVFAIEVDCEVADGIASRSVVAGPKLPYLHNFNHQSLVGGTWSGASSRDGIMSISVQAPGTYSIVVGGGDYSTAASAAYTLRIRSIPPAALDFDGGSGPVVAQPAETWRYFQVEVPADAIGWEVKLKDVTSGMPQIVVSRDRIPDPAAPQILASQMGYYPAGYRVLASGQTEATRYYSSPDGTVNESPRHWSLMRHSNFQPGTYFIGITGVRHGATTALSYRVESRGVGGNYSIPVNELAYAGGTAAYASLQPRDSAYYRVVIPADTPSWKVRLLPTVGEAMLSMWRESDTSWYGEVMDKLGSEHFIRIPNHGQTSIPAGTYYLRVLSEGVGPSGGYKIGTGTVAFTLESQGPLPVEPLGELGSTDIVESATLEAGEFKAYQFTVPQAGEAVEISLEQVLGRPAANAASGTVLPSMGYRSSYSEITYGIQGGATPLGQRIYTTSTLSQLTAGTYTILVQAHHLQQDSGSWSDASFDLRLHRAGAATLAFDQGEFTVVGQASDSWRFFRVEVPADAVGWDLTIEDVTSGAPVMVVRRDQVPESLLPIPNYNTPWYWGDSTWANGNQWPAGSSRDGRHSDVTPLDRSNDGAVDHSGRRFVAMRSAPLEPGTYHVGVTRRNWGTITTDPLSYRLVSRGIGGGYAIPITDVSFDGGSATATGLAPRGTAYYRVTVPPNTPSWKVRLQPTLGDASLAIWRDGDAMYYWAFMRKPGNEHFLRLPEQYQTSIPAGVYFARVVSEGVNPQPAQGRIGVGDADVQFQSMGVAPVIDLGTVDTDLTDVAAIEGGETRFYRFAIPNGLRAVEARFEGQSGKPALAVASGTGWPRPDYYTYSWNWSRPAYGLLGGQYAVTPITYALATLPEPVPGDAFLLVQADSGPAGETDYPDSTFTLRVRPNDPLPLNFAASQNVQGGSHMHTATLADTQIQYYRVEVPSLVDGSPVVGWKLHLTTSSGTATLRVRKDLLPGNYNEGTPAVLGSVSVVDPLLTPGTWYVEVKGVGAVAYTLSSGPWLPERAAWAMPAIGQPSITPGLTAPDFGDSGTDPAGVALPGDQGIDLGAGLSHLHRINVPAGNGGLIRFKLEAINGNPDLYVRQGLPPGQPDVQPYAVTVKTASVGTEYLAAVPLSGLETELAPGPWYAMVTAQGGSNTRYRLRVSTGDVQPLALHGGSYHDQQLAAGDWRYYRTEIPWDAPLSWTFSFVEHLGNVRVYVRDVVPPGDPFPYGWMPETEKVDWGDNNKNQGPYPFFDTPGDYTLTTPPLRPGNTYYLGVFAAIDSVFSISSTASVETIGDLPTVAFYGGSGSATVPPGATVTFRIPVPADGARWRHTSTHDAGIQVYIEQGTLPLFDGTADWQSYGNANSQLLNSWLSTASYVWPWRPGYSYYLTARNTTATPLPFSFTMDGINEATVDDDNDGLPDVWEIQYFTYTWQCSPVQDPDGDGNSNLTEWQDGTNPTSPQSALLTLVVTTSGGTVQRDPDLARYPHGTVVNLTPIPDSGNVFRTWGTDGSGHANPLAVTMTGHRTVTAAFATAAQVVGRFVFYNNSAWDGDDPAANAADDAAIAPDKIALLPGQVASHVNYSSYSKGINGVMIDLDLPEDTVESGDFEFKTGNTADPSTWATAPSPSAIVVRPGAGTGGADRVTILWPDNTIRKQWLEVIVKATWNTGLAAPDVFFFGNAVGEANNNAGEAKVDPSDILLARANPRNVFNPATITNPHDYNRDKRVDPGDTLTARANQTSIFTALRLLNLSAWQPTAVSGVPSVARPRAQKLDVSESAGGILSVSLTGDSTMVLRYRGFSSGIPILENCADLEDGRWQSTGLEPSPGPEPGQYVWELPLGSTESMQFFRVHAGPRATTAVAPSP